MSNQHPFAKQFPIGSTWTAPGSFAPDPSHPADEPITLHVINHTVGAGLKRNEDAGVMFRMEGQPPGTAIEIKETIALDTLERVDE